MAESSNFWARVDQSGGSEACWPCGPGMRHGKPVYSRVTHDGRTILSHRLAWTLTHGEIAPGLCVLHRCDNPPCVNPAHLFLGTLADNVADMYAKGRQGKPGRKLINPALKMTTIIRACVTQEEFELIQSAAAQAGLPVSVWARRVLIRAAQSAVRRRAH